MAKLCLCSKCFGSFFVLNVSCGMKEDVRKISMVKIILRIERQAHKTTFNLLFASIYIFSCFRWCWCCCCCCLFCLFFFFTNIICFSFLIHMFGLILLLPLTFVSIFSEDHLCWNWTFIIFSCFVLCAIIVERRHQVTEITESNEVCVSFLFFYYYCIKWYTLIQPAKNYALCIYRNGIFHL